MGRDLQAGDMLLEICGRAQVVIVGMGDEQVIKPGAIAQYLP